MANMATVQSLGEKGETALRNWFQNHGLAFVSICQSQETFANLFDSEVKRPDFLLLLESVGMIAVDVKNKARYKNKQYSLDIEQELRRGIAFERIFRIPLWYAFFGENSKWYWISALKAFEVGVTKEDRKSKEQFLAIDVDHFEEISTGKDIAKLYTHRLTGYTNVAKRTRGPTNSVKGDHQRGSTQAVSTYLKR